jgi:hypothetical protein
MLTYLLYYYIQIPRLAPVGGQNEFLKEFSCSGQSADTLLKETTSIPLQQLNSLIEMIPIIAAEENRFIANSDDVSISYLL